MAVDIRVPPVVFKTRREIDEAPGFEWYDLSANEMFGNKKTYVIYCLIELITIELLLVIDLG